MGKHEKRDNTETTVHETLAGDLREALDRDGTRDWFEPYKEAR